MGADAQKAPLSVRWPSALRWEGMAGAVRALGLSAILHYLPRWFWRVGRTGYGQIQSGTAGDGPTRAGGAA
jgi:hypothetical protein